MGLWDNVVAVLIPVPTPQALLLSGRCTGLYNYLPVCTKVGKLSLLLSMCPDGNRESNVN